MTGDGIRYNGQDFDMFANTQIALTLQAFDMQSIPSVKASITNQFTLPGTQKNCELFGYANNEAGETTVVRNTLKGVSLLNNGLPIQNDCTLSVIGFDGDSFTALITSNAKTFWDAINNKYLTDLDFSSINGKWDNARRDAQRANTTDLTSAIISVGQLLAGTPVDNYTNGSANPPIVYLKYILDRIFDLAGFSYGGGVFSNAGFLRSAIVAQFKMDPDWLRKKEFNASADGTQVIAGLSAGAEATVIFQNVQFNGDDLFYNASTGEWTVVNPDTALEYFSCGFFNKIDISVVGSNVDVLLKKNGTILASTLGVGSSVTTNGTIDAGYGPTKGFKAGDVVKVTIRGTGVSTITINQGSVFYAKCFESSDTVKPFEDSWYHYINQMMPKISLKQIMAEIMVPYNVLSKDDTTTISGPPLIAFKQFSEIAESPANDWSNRFNISQKPSQNYTPSYSQSNYFRWANGDVDELVNQGILSVTGDKLAKEQLIFQSVFEGSQMKGSFNIFAASMDLWSGSAFTGLTNIRSRMVMIRPKNANEPQVRFDAVGRNDYLVSYFNDSSQAYNLDWQLFINNNYARFAYCLSNYKLIEQLALLSTSDISTFDSFTPVIINNQKYLVNKIYQYIKGQLVKVQLFKI